MWESDEGRKPVWNAIFRYRYTLETEQKEKRKDELEASQRMALGCLEITRRCWYDLYVDHTYLIHRVIHL